MSRPTLQLRPPPRLDAQAASRLQGSARSSVVVVTVDGAIAYGVRACAEAGRGQMIPAITLPLSPVDIEGLHGADIESCPWDAQATAAAILDHHQVRRVQIGQVLDRSSIEVTRLIQYTTLHPAARAAVKAGHLTPAHVRPLVALGLADQARWIEQAIAGQWTTRQMHERVRSGLPHSEPGATATGGQGGADMAAYERQLSDRLGAKVSVQWPDAPGGRRLAVDWYGIDDLKGILSKLSAGPASTEHCPPRRRQLVIEVQNVDELSSLTEHLTEGV